MCELKPNKKVAALEYNGKLKWCPFDAESLNALMTSECCISKMTSRR